MMEQKLTGELDEHTVGKTLRYYSEYIDSEMRKGKTEQEVLEDLGSPLLIARTILDTQGNGTANFSQTRPEGKQRKKKRGQKAIDGINGCFFCAFWQFCFYCLRS